MKYLTERAMYYAFAINAIESKEGPGCWQSVAELFGVPPAERERVELLLSDGMLSCLKSAFDVSLLQKYGNGFGNAAASERPDAEILEVKAQAFLKLSQLKREQKTTLTKAISGAYRRDPEAAVIYALQILLRNKRRRELGYDILSDILFSDQNSDAGILLLNAGREDRKHIFSKLAETPEMILHPETLEELARANGFDPDAVERHDSRMGF